MSRTLRAELTNYFDSCLGIRNDERNYRSQIDEWELADRLERRGYCQEPYIEYEKALCCALNKKGEAICKAITCEHYNFCSLLRREGYITK